MTNPLRFEGPQQTNGQIAAVTDRAKYGIEHTREFAQIAVAIDPASWYAIGYFNITKGMK